MQKPEHKFMMYKSSTDGNQEFRDHVRNLSLDDTKDNTKFPLGKQKDKKGEFVWRQGIDESTYVDDKKKNTPPEMKKHYDNVGYDRADWELKAIKKALSMHSILNSPEENERLASVKAILKHKSKSKNESIGAFNIMQIEQIEQLVSEISEQSDTAYDTLHQVMLAKIATKLEEKKQEVMSEFGKKAE